MRRPSPGLLVFAALLAAGVGAAAVAFAVRALVEVPGSSPPATGRTSEAPSPAVTAEASPRVPPPSVVRSSGVRVKDPSSPNLVFVLTDDQRFDQLVAMPEVRALLSDHGVRFRNAFVTTPLCCPSRASILTGQYAHHTRVLDNSAPDGGALAFDDRSTLATWLHADGYTTALVGKYLNGYERLGRAYIPPGWDEWDVIHSEPQPKYQDYTLNQDGRLIAYGTAPEDYSTDVLGARAVEFARRARPPFYLEFAPIAPHKPWIPAARDQGRFASEPPFRPPGFNEADVSDKPWTQVYGRRLLNEDHLDESWRDMLGTLVAVDTWVGRIVRTIQARGQLDNTVIVFMSDNGYLLGEHRLTQKIWPYEPSIRVPLVVRVPWTDHPATDDHLVLNIDLASTFADLAGVRPRIPQDGRSLVPLLHGRAVTWRHSFLEEYLGKGRSPGAPPDYSAIRTERWMYVEYVNGWRELYDLRKDPAQLDNLAEDPGRSGLLARLARRIRALSSP